MNQSTAIQKTEDRDKILERVIAKGDLADLTPEQRVSYYNALCHSLKLNPMTKPFDFLETYDKDTNKTKIILYANKDCAAQLRDRDSISIYQLDESEENGYYRVTAHARDFAGRIDVDKSVVMVKGLVGKSYENAIKKCVTQAKRRVTLSICGLGFLDESEIDSIPNAQPINHPEQDAVMTDQEALTLSYKASGLDQWACGRPLAMNIITICKALEAAGVSEGIWREWLPLGIQSRKELTEDQALFVFDDFTSRLKVIHVCMQLGAKGVDKETMRTALPGGAKSVFSLTSDQTQEALKKFTHWLKSFEETEKEAKSNG